MNKGKITFSPGLSWNSKTRMDTALESVSKPWQRKSYRVQGHQDGRTGTDSRMGFASATGI